MSLTDTAPTLHDVGYRQAILGIGALWGAVPALTFGLQSMVPVGADLTLVLSGFLVTLNLGVLFELDSRTLAAHGRGVPLAWSYALVAPLSYLLVFFVPVVAAVAILLGPPAAALCYCWQRGRVASVA